MASLRDIRKRIRSVKNSQKITGAMKLVAAAKLKRAQDAVVAARPYAFEMASLLARVAAKAGQDEATSHPLLQVREPKKVLLLVLSSDRGLCGAFNSNILRRAERFVRENEGRFEKLEMLTVGRKARDFFKKRKYEHARELPNVLEGLNYGRAVEIADQLAQEFVSGQFDAVYVVFNEFKSAMSQTVKVNQLLPLASEELPKGGESVDYIYEPNAEAVLEKLVPRYVATLIWRSLLESVASEHGSRMSAMDSATKNAKDLASSLTLQYNRARQAAITRELVEIVSGAEALKG